MGAGLKRLLEMIVRKSDAATSANPDLAHKRFSLFNRARLVLLAAGLAGFWYLAAPAVLSQDEALLWEKVRAAQLHLAQWRRANETASPAESDPWNCGLIGLEWSGITTTLGELASKRTACNPAWAVQFNRWFHQLGLQPHDPIVIYSSASFPGMLLNALAAAEAMQLEPFLIVSLGASTWGANHPDMPWPVLAAELRSNGFISKRADYYTLGGGSELWHGLPPEGEALLRTAARDSGVKLLTADDLEGMIRRKMELLEGFQPRVFINIGGSQANLGNAEEVLRLPPGLLPVSESGHAGNGVIGLAMRKDIPVIHLLNLKSLGRQVGIPYDGTLRKMAPVHVRTWWSVAGVLLFFVVLFTHRRWKLEPSAD